MTPQQIKAMKQALEALKNIGRWLPTIGQKGLRDYEADAITALEEALEQTQEPDDGYCKACDGWKCTSKAGCVALDNPPQRTWVGSGDLEDSNAYLTTPQEQQSCDKRTWVGLTDEQRSQLVTLHHGWNEYGQAIEASLKQQNGYAEENT